MCPRWVAAVATIHRFPCAVCITLVWFGADVWFHRAVWVLDDGILWMPSYCIPGIQYLGCEADSEGGFARCFVVPPCWQSRLRPGCLHPRRYLRAPERQRLCSSFCVPKHHTRWCHIALEAHSRGCRGVRKRPANGAADAVLGTRHCWVRWRCEACGRGVGPCE